MRKDKESYRLLKKKRVSPSTKIVRYTSKQAHIVDLTHETFSRKLKKFFLIDIDSEEEIKIKDKDGKMITYYGGQLRYMGSNIRYSAGTLSFLTVEGGIRQLASGMGKRLLDTNTIILLIFGVGLGLMTGLFFGWFF